MGPYPRILGAVVITFSAGFVGYLFLNSHAIEWYEGLQLPPLGPAGTMLGTLWLLFHAFAAASLAIIAISHKGPDATEMWIRFFFIQLLFDVMWVVFFFQLHTLLVALIDALVWEFIVVTLVADATNIDKRAAWAMAPFMLCILFAAYINMGVWLLN